MMSRVGGFPPTLARYFIAAYSRPGEVVVDPFCGKGTVLLEAAGVGRRAIGGDVSREAVVSATAKSTKVSIAEVAYYIEQLPERSRASSPVDADVRLFFHQQTMKELLAVRGEVLKDMALGGRRAKVATFVCGVLLGILHGHSRLALSLSCNQCFAMSPQYVRRYVKEHGLTRPRRSVKQCVLEKALELLPFPQKMETVKVYERPAQECAKYLGRVRGGVSLVLTSPPYLHRQTYVKDAWLRLWLLGVDRRDIMSKSLETGSIPRFWDGMQQFMSGLLPIVKRGGIVVLVCGRANVTICGYKQSVRIADICLHALEACPEVSKAFVVKEIIVDRKVMKRGSYFAVHAGKTNGHNGSTGRRYGEDEILILQRT